ncbi:TPA: hypothetical protein HA239_06110 [Candidatus Woesearchaeota archaeon]|nr:hypothetical protein QT06_C0001G1323 [archaeon GW2011_AR15]MBS3104219.1 hypothetical protein [Candidatus Woesearchaeota archaeon]HIH41950.1 hypothetical protein [Candidatus Woesearchaeota archaeon]
MAELITKIIADEEFERYKSQLLSILAGVTLDSYFPERDDAIERFEYIFSNTKSSVARYALDTDNGLSIMAATGMPQVIYYAEYFRNAKGSPDILGDSKIKGYFNSQWRWKINPDAEGYATYLLDAEIMTPYATFSHIKADIEHRQGRLDRFFKVNKKKKTVEPTPEFSGFLKTNMALDGFSFYNALDSYGHRPHIREMAGDIRIRNISFGNLGYFYFSQTANPDWIADFIGENDAMVAVFPYQEIGEDIKQRKTAVPDFNSMMLPPVKEEILAKLPDSIGYNFGAIYAVHEKAIADKLAEMLADSGIDRSPQIYYPGRR